MSQSKTNYLIEVDKSPYLHAYIHDAKRFILYNRPIIEMAPLQTYYSSLVFGPERGLVRKQYENQMPRRIYRLRKGKKD